MQRHSQPRMIHESWTMMEWVCTQLADQVRSYEPVGVYGEPRGGLCMAVYISHYLQVPLVRDLAPRVLWVDEIVETGRTLRAALQQCDRIIPRAWYATGKYAQTVRAFKTKHEGEWIVFPWESRKHASADARQYIGGRE